MWDQLEQGVQQSFLTLKNKLSGALTSVYPRVDKEESQFHIQTDSSVIGLGTVAGGGGGGGGGMSLAKS